MTSATAPEFGSHTNIDWIFSEGVVAYPDAVEEMEDHVDAMIRGDARDQIWMLEHPPLYTAGTSTKEADLLQARFPVYKTGRGGQLTYHGPGQRVIYPMLDLRLRRQDLRWYVHRLEQWVIDALASFNLTVERRAGRVGLWVDMSRHGGKPGTEAKIAAIGIRVWKWVAYHGIAINLDPALDHFDGIVPCGIREHGVTSMVALGLPVTMDDLDLALAAHLPPELDPPTAHNTRS